MKRKLSLFGIIALAAMIGFTMFGCDDPKDNDKPTADPCASGHAFPEWTAPTCTVAGNSVRTCTRSGCNAFDRRTTGYEKLPHTAGAAATCTTSQTCSVCSERLAAKLPHTFISWSMKTAADCITPEIEKGTCAVCGEEETRYSESNHALGHTGTVAEFAATCTTAGNSTLSGNCVRFAQCGHVVTGTVLAALGHSGNNWAITTLPNFSAETDGEETRTCSTCSTPETRVYKFYKIGDTGPAGGIIFYVATDGITVQGYGSSGDNGYFAEYTAYYLEAALANETNSIWGAQGTLIADVTTWANETARDAGLTASIGVGKKDTQTIVNSAAFAALTNTAAQRCASKNTGGKTDWFLPSLGELNEMYNARTHLGISSEFFWSSSQRNINFAWIRNFGDGDLYPVVDKDFIVLRVRAIRAF